MKNSTKIILLIIIIIFITVGVTLWISDLFRKDNSKENYKQAVERYEQLKKDYNAKTDSLNNAHNLEIDGLLILTVEQENELIEVKLKNNENEKIYQKLYNSITTNKQLDSLLSEFERKNNY